MKDDEIQDISKALKDFVIRVANGNATSDTEISILPEVAKMLLESNYHALN